MDNDTKVLLSVGELAMATDKNIILTKQAIIEKAVELFRKQIPIISETFRQIVMNDKALISAVPKISRGENYNRFPYVMMDYPASFSRENIFALRTMFWWGNFISITLHLKGDYKKMYSAKILNMISDDPDIYVSVGEDEWQHHFGENNFRKNSTITKDLEKRIERSNVLKVALKYELHHFNMMQSFLPEGYKKLAITIGD